MRAGLLVAAVFAALVPVAGHAGEERESVSFMRGVFLSFEQGGLVSFDSQDSLLELVQHCSRGGAVRDHTRGRSYRCGTTMLAGADAYSPIRVEILGVAPRDEGEVAHVFTIQPRRPAAWQQRSLSAQEAQGVAMLIKADPARHGSLAARLDFAHAKAVSKPGSAFTTYFVPGEQVKDEEGYYDAQRHHVFVARRGVFSYQGRLAARPTQYVDLDGDDFPEVVVEEGCDGLCISIWSVHSGPKRLGTLGGH